MSCITAFKERGLRLTRQRRLILDILHDSGARLTSEEIINVVQDKMPRVNKSTVYRTLGLLEKLGCIYRSGSGDGSFYHHAEDGHHYHIECLVCGKTADCGEDIFRSVETALNERHGFQISLRHVVMRGLCRGCRSNTWRDWQ